MLYAIQAVPPVMASSITLEDSDIDEAVQLRYEQLLHSVSFEREQALQRVDRANARRNDAADKNRTMKPLQVGDMVLAKVLGKDNTAGARWFGPYEIYEIDDMNNYVLKAPNGSMCLRRFPRSHLKKADMRMREMKMVADRIGDARMAGGMLEYKVGFKGYNKDSDVWVKEQVVKAKYPTLLARFEEAKNKLMMQVSLEEGQKLSERLDEEELVALDGLMSAPRRGLMLAASEEDDGVAATTQVAPLGSRFGAGEERVESHVGTSHTSPSQFSNADPRLANTSYQVTPVPATHGSQSPNQADSFRQQPVRGDNYDQELQELRSAFQEIERRRNAAPQPDHEAALLVRNPAAEARHRYYAQQYYGNSYRNRGYGRAPRRTRNDEDSG